jgi:hypothetical protein
MHQITACSLYKLMKAAYNDNCIEVTEDQSSAVLSSEDWCKKREHQSPQFQFWHMVLSMELVIMLLIRAFREANFTLYCEALSALIPYFCANKDMNYARWIPIHLKYMLTLEQKHPLLASEFQKGTFVVHKSSRVGHRPSSRTSQCHYQRRRGAIGVTEDPTALRRWMVAGPVVSHLVAQYDAASVAKDVTEHSGHHEQTERTQRLFFEKVDKLTVAMQEIGNPFQE